MISLKSNAARVPIPTDNTDLVTLFPEIGNIDPVDRSSPAKEATKLDLIKIHTARMFELTPRQLDQNNRTKRYTEARHAFYVVARAKTKFSLKVIGMAVRRWDHTTVSNGLKRAQELIKRNPVYRLRIERLMERV